MLLQEYRQQGAAHKSEGEGAIFTYDGSYSTELFTSVSIGSSITDGEVVAAVAGYKIRVLSYGISSSTPGPSRITFNTKGAGAGVAITPIFYLAANAQAREADNNGLFETLSGESLTATTNLNNTYVALTYVLVN
jgi:hypothetical protein